MVAYKLDVEEGDETMFNICVCDDSDEMRHGVEDMIKKLSEKHRIGVSVYGFSSGEEMLFELSESKKYIDIFFLDMLMKKLNGIETAKELRKINPSAQIIFLTVSKEHVFDALDVMPLHYLIKQDVKTSKIEDVFLKAVSLAQKNRQDIFTYKSGNTVGSVPLKDIVYFEVQNRIIELHLENKEVISFYGNISDLENELPADTFQRIHRSFIINFENAEYLKGKDFVCCEGSTVPVGHKYIDVKDKFQNFLLDKISDMN